MHIVLPFDKVMDWTHEVRTDMILSARTTTLPDSALEHILAMRLWRAFGYEKLWDYLDQELGLPRDRVFDWVATAIRRDLEPGTLYGLPPTT